MLTRLTLASAAVRGAAALASSTSARFPDSVVRGTDAEAAARPLATLPATRDLDGVAALIADGARCVVMLGAGASVAAGLPDFRTPGTGLYDNLQAYGLPYPEAVFELDFFKTNPEPFYSLARSLWPGRESKPTKAHAFVRALADRGQLVRCYTQNIDSLERAAGVPGDAVVAAHGNFDGATCVDTGAAVDVAAFEEALFAGDMDAFNEASGGLCKSDIVFFGESLPPRFWATLEPDFARADLLVVVGTSLEVHPFASLVDLGGMPRVLINREDVGPFDFAANATVPRDVFLQGDADATIEALAAAAGVDLPSIP